MKSITIHDLNIDLYKRLTEKAKEQGLSLNKTINNLLEHSLGKKMEPKQDFRDDFREFFGIWSETEATAFNQSINLKTAVRSSHSQFFYLFYS